MPEHIQKISSSNDKGSRLPSSALWDASKHLCFSEPAKCYTLKEFGIDDSKATSPIAISEPFPLFTLEAVKELRRDLLSDGVVESNRYPSTFSCCYLREFNRNKAPFTFQAYKSPEVTAAISKAAGIELVPIMDLEIGHANVQVETSTSLDIETLRELSATPSQPLPPVAEESVERDGSKVVNWHVDAYPWVLVVMLSHTDTMIGGETALRCGDGSIRKVRGPNIGDAFIFQGRYIEHMACKAFNSAERITSVTSYRAKDVMKPDASHLTIIRTMTVPSRLNHQWIVYRLELLSERLATYSKIIKDRKGDEDETNIVTITKKEMAAFITQQIEYLQATVEEMM